MVGQSITVPTVGVSHTGDIVLVVWSGVSPLGSVLWLGASRRCYLGVGDSHLLFELVLHGADTSQTQCD